tara:strand:+ start:255 stop:578 length:324 start_codon:yes stop_codon:yes gene_type:complete
MASLAQHIKQSKKNNPTITKKVDGLNVPLAADEYEALIKEWAEVTYKKEIARTIKAKGGKHPNYSEFRKEAYGSIGDQLDMQYKDAVNGTATWLDHIAAVKAKYQKP